MRETAQLSQLIGDIYDASLDAGLWPKVLEGIARYVPGSFVNLFSQNAIHPEAKAFYTYGIKQEYLTLYFEKYIHLNPMFPATLFFEVGRIITEDDIMPRSEFVASRFFQEWVKPQGLLDHSMASILEKTATSIAAIAVCRGEGDGPLEEPSMRRMALSFRMYAGQSQSGTSSTYIRWKLLLWPTCSMGLVRVCIWWTQNSEFCGPIPPARLCWNSRQ